MTRGRKKKTGHDHKPGMLRIAWKCFAAFVRAGCKSMMYVLWGLTLLILAAGLVGGFGEGKTILDSPCWHTAGFAMVFTGLHLFFKYGLMEALETAFHFLDR